MAPQWHDEDKRLRHRRFVGRWLPLAMAILGTLYVGNSIFPENPGRGLMLAALFWGSYIAAVLRGMMAPPLVVTRGSDPAARVMDEETSLGNRLQLKAQLTRELARIERFGGMAALAAIDVQVVGYNPLYPGELPPSPAKFVAKVLREEIREADIAFRVEDGAFAVLFAGGEREGVQTVCERIRQRLKSTPYGRSHDARALFAHCAFGAVPLQEKASDPMAYWEAALGEAQRVRERRAAS